MWLPFQDTSKTIFRFATDEARRTISRYKALTAAGSFTKIAEEASGFLQDAPLPSPRASRNRVKRHGLRGDKPTLREKAVHLALHNGEVRTKDLTEIGVPRCYLKRMCDEGLLIKVGYGRYRATSRILMSGADGIPHKKSG